MKTVPIAKALADEVNALPIPAAEPTRDQLLGRANIRELYGKVPSGLPAVAPAPRPWPGLRTLERIRALLGALRQK